MSQEGSSTTTRRSARRSREQARRLSRLTEAQAALGWAVILVLLALLGVIYLSQASRIAVVGRRVQQLQGELDGLKRENAELERLIAAAQSLERLQERAIQQGFRTATTEDIEYIIVPNYPVVASQPEPVVFTAAPVVLPSPPETMQEAVWLAWQASMSNLIRGESREQ